MEHPLKNGFAPPLIWHTALFAIPELFCPVLIIENENVLPMSLNTTYFCVPAPILLGWLRSTRRELRLKACMPLHKPPPRLPGHDVAPSTSMMSAWACGASKNSAAKVTPPMIKVRNVLVIKLLLSASAEAQAINPRERRCIRRAKPYS